LPGVSLLLRLWAVVVALQGCQGNGPEQALEEYLERLGQTLQVEVPPVTPIPLPLPPRPGAMQVEFPSSDLDALDFLALTGCEVQVTIGKRNSSLGRMAAPSQRLLLELEYLRLAPECIGYQRHEGRDNLADTLLDAWQAKRDQLPGLIFNGTLAGPEYRQFWRATIAPGDYPAATGSQVISALEAINSLAQQWLDGDYRADNLQFEILLGEVATGDGGALMEALALQYAWLAAADNIVSDRQSQGPLCAPGSRFEAADTLPKVVRKFFVDGIQPHSAALGHRYYQLLPPVLVLEALLENTLPSPFLSWREQRQVSLDNYMAAPRQHVKSLQAILAPCGGMNTGG